MNTAHLIKILTILAVSTLVVACGGGGGSISTSPIPEPEPEPELPELVNVAGNIKGAVITDANGQEFAITAKDRKLWEFEKDRELANTFVDNNVKLFVDGVDEGLIVLAQEPVAGVSAVADASEGDGVAVFGREDSGIVTLLDIETGTDANSAVTVVKAAEEIVTLVNNDLDGDSRDNTDDNCPIDRNQQQTDTDGDGVGDVCDNAPPPDEAVITFLSNFETGAIQEAATNPDGWAQQSSGLPYHEVVTAAVQAPFNGNYSLQEYLDKADWPVASAPGNKPRAQLQKPYTVHPFNQGTEYWVGVATFWPRDWVMEEGPDQTEVFWQFHGVGGADVVPPLSLNWSDGLLSISSRWGDFNGPSFRSESLWTATDIPKGSWVSWIIRVKFSTDDDGILQVWKDGRLIIDRVGYANYYYTTDRPRRSDGTYFTVSIYKGKWLTDPSTVTDHTMYYDEIRFATGINGYSLVDPAGY